MREVKYHLCLSDSKWKVVLQNLVWIRRQLHCDGHFTDKIDDLIIKFSETKKKKAKVI